MSKRSLLLIVLLVVSTALSALAQAASVSYGQVVTGTISNDKPRDTYTFEGTAGDALAIRMTATAEGLDSFLELTTPSGQQYVNDDSSGSVNSLLLIVLPEDGTYTIGATRCCGGNPVASEGSYELVVEQIELVPLTVGEAVTVEVNDSQPQAFLSFEFEPGQVVSLQAERIGGDADFMIEARNAQGTVVNSAWQMPDGTVSLDPLFLDADGRTIFVVGRQMVPAVPAEGVSAATGSVQLTLTVQQIASDTISIGDTVSGTLNNENPVDYYVFDGTSSELLRLLGTKTEGSQDFEVLVYMEQGSVTSGASTSYTTTPNALSLDPLQLPGSGRYLLHVHQLDVQGSGDMGTTEYTLTLSGSETAFLEPGVAVTGGFAEGVFDQVYRFEGTEGQTVRMTLQSMSEDYAPALSVQGPELPSETTPNNSPNYFYVNMSGNASGIVSYETTLPVSGTYLFHVGNGMYSYDLAPEATFSLMVEVIN